jgi:hypothetical protein
MLSYNRAPLNWVCWGGGPAHVADVALMWQFFDLVTTDPLIGGADLAVLLY